jgi:hypothetical protein
MLEIDIIPKEEEVVQPLAELAVTVNTVSIPVILGTESVPIDAEPQVHYKMAMGVAVEIYEVKASAELETQEVDAESAEVAVNAQDHVGKLEQFGDLIPAKRSRLRFEWILPIATGTIIAIVGVGAGLVIAMVY